MSDVTLYVGPLCRYMAGDWAGDRLRGGSADSPIRAPDRSPEEIIDEALDWHGRVAMWLVEKYGRRAQTEWEERPDGKYFSGTIGLGGLLCLRALVYYAERPARTKPATVADVIRKRHRLDKADPKLSAFPQVLAPEMWVPVDRNIVFNTPVLGGPDICIGSSGALLRHLVRLNAGTVEGQQADIEEWSAGPLADDATFERGTRYGLAVMLKHAEISVRLQLPLVLSY